MSFLFFSFHEKRKEAKEKRYQKKQKNLPYTQTVPKQRAPFAIDKRIAEHGLSHQNACRKPRPRYTGAVCAERRSFSIFTLLAFFFASFFFLLKEKRRIKTKTEKEARESVLLL
ncbi:MAG: hypothetical protein J6J21_06490 [Clostridia bacterium]|nr:hypothetical protein [Clostridia bacterium]